nr:aminoglycoside adenylyltransferase domain-containing protein [uncultured Actinoplanes sp.]
MIRARGLILSGSLAGDDFVPGRSDIDLLLVVEHGLQEDDVVALTAAVAEADPSPAAGIDLHVVTAATARRPGPAPALELHVGRYPGAALEVQAEVAGDPDLCAELSMARAGGISLFGPPAADLIGDVAPEWLHARGSFWLDRWLGLTGDVRHADFMVLTACRIWRFRVEGTHASKTAAARWALDRDGSLSAVRQALAARTGGEPTVIEEDEIRRVLLAALVTNC